MLYCIRCIESAGVGVLNQRVYIVSEGVLPSLVSFQGVAMSFHTEEEDEGESNDMSMEAAVRVEVVAVVVMVVIVIGINMF